MSEPIPSAATYVWALARIEALEQLISESSPLTWAATSDTDSARDWERRAGRLLAQLGEEP